MSCRDVEHQRILVCTARALTRSTGMNLPGIEFVGFSNPKVWDLERLLGSDPEVLAKAKALPQREQWRLAEILDPDTFTHYEFFLKKGSLGQARFLKDSAGHEPKKQYTGPGLRKDLSYLKSLWGCRSPDPPNKLAKAVLFGQAGTRLKGDHGLTYWWRVGACMPPRN